MARARHEEEELAAYADELRRFGWKAEYLDGGRMRAEVDSPTYLGGLWKRTGSALVDPARLAWGLALAALDLVDGTPSELTRLRLVRSKPIPFPPEPLRWLGIQLTRRELVRADRSGGRRGLWLRTLDRLGLGFDS